MFDGENGNAVDSALTPSIEELADAAKHDKPGGGKAPVEKRKGGGASRIASPDLMKGYANIYNNAGADILRRVVETTKAKNPGLRLEEFTDEQKAAILGGKFDEVKIATRDGKEVGITVDNRTRELVNFRKGLDEYIDIHAEADRAEKIRLGFENAANWTYKKLKIVGLVGKGDKWGVFNFVVSAIDFAGDITCKLVGVDDKVKEEQRLGNIMTKEKNRLGLNGMMADDWQPGATKEKGGEGRNRVVSGDLEREARETGRGTLSGNSPPSDDTPAPKRSRGSARDV